MRPPAVASMRHSSNLGPLRTSASTRLAPGREEAMVAATAGPISDWVTLHSV